MGSWRTEYQRVFNDPRIALDLDLVCALGTNPHVRRIRKYGYNEDSVAGSWRPVWSYGAAYTWISTAQVLYLSSDAAADTSIPIYLIGLDANWNEITETVTLNATNGRLQVVTTQEFMRIHRAFNVGTKAQAGQVYIYTYSPDAGGDGIPDDTTAIKAVIPAADHQTQMAIYTIPEGKLGYVKFGQVSVLPDANPTNQRAAKMRFRWRYPDENTVWRTTEQEGLTTNGTSSTELVLGDGFLGPVDLVVEGFALTSNASLTSTLFIYEFDVE